MIPSRYFIIDERSPYPVKRQARGGRGEGGDEPAITLLPPDPYLLIKKPDFGRSLSPAVYKTVPPKSAKNKEASSFVILGDTIRTPVQSRPGSPSGRVSPFRGHGFKSPATTRPNSRAASPSDSPRRQPSSGRSEKTGRKAHEDRPRIGRDIGLPPKSPSRSTEVQPTKDPADPSSDDAVCEEASNEDIESSQDRGEEEGNEKEEKAKNKPESSRKNWNKGGKMEVEKIIETMKGKKEIEEETEATVSRSKNLIAEQKLSTRERSPKPPISPKPKSKVEKNESNTQDKQSVVKKTTKPPLPPKKVGLKSTLQSEQTGNDQGKKNSKEIPKGRAKEVKEREKLTEKKSTAGGGAAGGGAKAAKSTDKKKEKSEVKKEREGGKEEADTRNGDSVGSREVPSEGVKKSGEIAKEKQEGDGRAGEKAVEKNEEKRKENLIPCFQPDKCQIAPPTMASPSPIITPTISTPSTSADLSSSSMKNSQSIATAPTAVTPSTLSSVSSTVVLTGNLARKEIQHIRSKSKEAGEVKIDSEKAEKNTVVAKENEGSAVDCASAEDKVSKNMVKGGSKDSIKWSNKENLCGEITSATKVIKAEPDMEVLSPNNLRDVPPRLPPPNLAWDEQRLPNGDVPNRAGNESKFRRFVSAVWRLLSYLFCCRYSKCCRRANLNEIPNPSIFSRLNCCKNPFKCCCANCTCCKSKCCESGKCCGRKAKVKSKPKKCCAKPSCSFKNCCDNMKTGCLNGREKLNGVCRSLFCLNMMSCQKLLRKCKFCHKLKCCQQNGFCSCFNPYVKKEKKLHKRGSHASNNSRDKNQLDLVLVESTSLMKAAIPVLPICLAIFCLICNLFVPGFGTLFSGILCLCFGKPRFSAKDSPKNRLGSFIVNTIIAVAQLFTVVFCLVGWGWSIWWGVIMYKLSRRQKRIKLARQNMKEAEGSNVNHNHHVDVEQG